VSGFAQGRGLWSVAPSRCRSANAECDTADSNRTMPAIRPCNYVSPNPCETRGQRQPKDVGPHAEAADARPGQAARPLKPLKPLNADHLRPRRRSRRPRRRSRRSAAAQQDSTAARAYGHSVAPMARAARAAAQVQQNGNRPAGELTRRRADWPAPHVAAQRPVRRRPSRRHRRRRRRQAAPHVRAPGSSHGWPVRPPWPVWPPT
jgi:hypothetical protein